MGHFFYQQQTPTANKKGDNWATNKNNYNSQPTPNTGLTQQQSQTTDNKRETTSMNDSENNADNASAQIVIVKRLVKGSVSCENRWWAN